MNKTNNRCKTYEFTGISESGHPIRGSIQSNSLLMARIALGKKNIKIHLLKQKKVSLSDIFFNRIKHTDITQFSRQLATLIQAGIPLVQSIDIIAKGENNKHVHTLLLDIKNHVQSGFSLFETLKQYPKYFNSLFCSLVYAGEQSGTLATVLTNLVNYKEKSQQIKKKIKQAMAYPITVLMIAVLCTVGLLMFVVPQFKSLYEGFGANLPTLTIAVIAMSNYVQIHGLRITIFLILGISAMLFANNYSLYYRHLWDRLILRIPIIGYIINQSIIARFTQSLAITSSAGLPLVEALTIISGVTDNSVYAQATKCIRDEISCGQSVSSALIKSTVFPNQVIQMIEIGEESGSLDTMLTKIAAIYEEEVNNSIDSLSSLLEPIIMSVLGILVGGLVLAMYLPIFKLGTVI